MTSGISNVLRIDIILAYNEIKDAKTPLEALQKLSEFNDFFDGYKPVEAKAYAWCMWLMENGYHDWIEHIKLEIRAVSALLSGNIDEAEKLLKTTKPKGWVENWKDYLRR